MNNKRWIKKTDGFTHFYFSHLQKNGKVREMITATHNFSGSFVDQRASPVWPGTVEFTSAQETRK